MNYLCKYAMQVLPRERERERAICWHMEMTCFSGWLLCKVHFPCYPLWGGVHLPVSLWSILRAHTAPLTYPECGFFLVVASRRHSQFAVHHCLCLHISGHFPKVIRIIRQCIYPFADLSLARFSCWFISLSCLFFSLSGLIICKLAGLLKLTFSLCYHLFSQRCCFLWINAFAYVGN